MFGDGSSWTFSIRLDSSNAFKEVFFTYRYEIWDPSTGIIEIITRKRICSSRYKIEQFLNRKNFENGGNSLLDRLRID